MPRTALRGRDADTAAPARPAVSRRPSPDTPEQSPLADRPAHLVTHAAAPGSVTRVALGLQRSAGNRAVTALLRAAHRPAPAGGSDVVVQRNGDKVKVWYQGRVHEWDAKDSRLGYYTRSFEDPVHGTVKYSPQFPPAALQAPAATSAVGSATAVPRPAPGRPGQPQGPPTHVHGRPTPAPASGYGYGYGYGYGPGYGYGGPGAFPGYGSGAVGPSAYGPPQQRPAPPGGTPPVHLDDDQTDETPLPKEPVVGVPGGLDPVGYATQKLAGRAAADDPAEQEQRRQRLDRLRAARVVVLHRTPGPGYLAGHDLLNPGSDFTGQVFCHAVSGVVRILNLVSPGLYQQARTFLRALSVDAQVRTSRAAPDTEAYVRAGLGGVERRLMSPVDLSVLPLSVVRHVLDRPDVVVDVSVPRRLVAFRLGQTQHLAVEIAWANGDVVEALVSVLHAAGVQLGSVNLHGICGSLDESIGRDRMVRPTGTVRSTAPEHRATPLTFENASTLAAAEVVVDHGHVTGVLDETPPVVEELRLLKVRTVEMEAYHLLRSLRTVGWTGTIRMVFTVSDVVTSASSNLSQAAPRTPASMAARLDRDLMVLRDFQLLPAAPASAPAAASAAPSTSGQDPQGST